MAALETVIHLIAHACEACEVAFVRPIESTVPAALLTTVVLACLHGRVSSLTREETPIEGSWSPHRCLPIERERVRVQPWIERDEWFQQPIETGMREAPSRRSHVRLDASDTRDGDFHGHEARDDVLVAMERREKWKVEMCEIRKKANASYATGLRKGRTRQLARRHCAFSGKRCSFTRQCILQCT